VKSYAHLISAGVAFVILMVGIFSFDAYAKSLEQRYINSLAKLDLSQFANGSALQLAALHQPDLLPLYGSSEITLLKTPYEASTFFRNYPTGFMVFDIANMGASSLTIAQALASLGPDLKDKKVVISITPSTATMGPLGGVNADNYTGNFSLLHANELAFSPYLSFQLKKQAASRMLTFPETLKTDPLLHFTLSRLASDSPGDRALYFIAWPLGELQTAIIRLLDHRAVVSYVLRRSLDPAVQQTPQTIDWAALQKTALAEQQQHSDSNPYGVDNSRWDQIRGLLANPLPTGSRDAAFVNSLQSATEWVDLDIELQVLDELGAKALILSRPMNVQLWEGLGVSEHAQNFYYQKLSEVVDPYHLLLINFRQYGTDKYFSIDMASHTSREGWIYVDQALDDFYHGRIQ
jgi:D-alanine transfer protein